MVQQEETSDMDPMTSDWYQLHLLLELVGQQVAGYFQCKTRGKKNRIW